MKRVSDGGGPPSKRVSDGEGTGESSTADTGLLRRQNQLLGQELVRYKRQIAESREEMEMIRGKSRDMEALVSAIQRSWSQVSSAHTFLPRQSTRFNLFADFSITSHKLCFVA
jgi:hypothetical protein